MEDIVASLTVDISWLLVGFGDDVVGFELLQWPLVVE